MDSPINFMYRSVQVITTISFCILSISGLWGQEAVLSAGSDASGAGGTVAYSVGQVAYTHISNEEGAISLGVQQPNLVIVVGTDNLLPTISVSLYPNPVSTNGILDVFRSTLTATLSDCWFELYDISGRLLLHQEIVDRTTNVSMGQYENAMYLLKVRCQDADIKTFKVIKTN